MAECFCGCGRRIGFKDRGINKQGLRTVGLLAKLREACDKHDRNESAENPLLLYEAAVAAGADEGDPDSVLRMATEQIHELVEDGERFEEFWTEAVHHGYLPPPSEARQIKKAWTEWGKAGMLVISAWGLPPERGLGAAFRGRV